MTSYADIDHFRGPDGRLDQFTTDTGVPDESRDTFLQECLDEATSIINTELGFTLTAAASGTQVVYGTGTVFLQLPRFTPASVTLVTAPSNYTIPSYVEYGSALRVTNSSGVFTIAPVYELTRPNTYAYGGYGLDLDYGLGSRWLPGVPYTVTAAFGVTADDLVTARMCALEIAVQLFKFRDAGGSTVIGTEAAAVTVKNDYSPVVRRMLGYLRREQPSHYAMVY